MRTIIKVQKLRELLGSLDLNFVNAFGKNYKSICITKNWYLTKNALDELGRDYSFLRYEIKAIYDSNASLESIDEIRLEESDRKQLTEQLYALKKNISIAIAALAEIAVDDQKEQLNIKLPENISLREASYIAAEFDSVFNSPYLKKLNNGNSAFLAAVDSGTDWWLIGGLSIFALNFLGRLIKSVIEIKKEIIITKMMEIKVKMMEIDLQAKSIGANVLKDFSETMITYRTLLINNKIQELSCDNSIEDESEMFNIYERLFKLHFNGVETYPSINAPKETIEQFPSEKEQLDALFALSQLSSNGHIPKELEKLISLLGSK